MENNKNIEVEIKVLEEKIKKNPEKKELYLKIANFNEMMELFPENTKDFKIITNIISFYYYNDIYFKEGINSLNNFREKLLNEGFEDKINLITYITDKLGRFYMRTKDYHKIIKLYNSLNINENKESTTQLGLAYYKVGDYSNTIKYLENSYSLDKERKDKVVIYYLAYSYFMLKNYNKAEKLFMELNTLFEEEFQEKGYYVSSSDSKFYKINCLMGNDFNEKFYEFDGLIGLLKVSFEQNNHEKFIKFNNKIVNNSYNDGNYSLNIELIKSYKKHEKISSYILKFIDYCEKLINIDYDKNNLVITLMELHYICGEYQKVLELYRDWPNIDVIDDLIWYSLVRAPENNGDIAYEMFKWLYDELPYGYIHGGDISVALEFYTDAIKHARTKKDRDFYVKDFFELMEEKFEYIDSYEVKSLLDLYIDFDYIDQAIALYGLKNHFDDDFSLSKLIEKKTNTNLQLKYEKKINEIKIKHEKEKQILQQNIMQAVSHTLGNMLFVQKGITQHLYSSSNLENDIKRLQLFQTMTSSVLDSIKVAFGGNIDNNIEFFDKGIENSISLGFLFYFSLALNLENLLFAGQEWEKKRKKLFSINSQNRKDIFAKLYEIKDNPRFQILELSDKDILNFKDFFASDEFNFVSRYFEIDVEVLSSIFVKKDSYTFAIIFVIFQELIKNMFKYGSTKTNDDVVFKIIANNDKKIGLVFENRFLDSKAKNKIGTLKGLKMIEMFAKVLGSFKNNSNEEKFSIKIEIDKKFFEKEDNENIMD